MNGKLCWIVIAAVVSQLGWSSGLAEETVWVRISPPTTDAILANPGMGWETFHRTAADDRNLPAGFRLPSITCDGAGGHWSRPGPDRLYVPRRGTLRQTREAKQKLAFRVMCCSKPSRPYHPAWLQSAGGRSPPLAMAWRQTRGARTG